MVEVVQWSITYLMVGAIVQMVLQGLAGWLESPKLNVKESIGTIAVWPIAVIVFLAFFIRGILGNREE